MATLRGEPVDRLAVNLYEIGGLVMDPNDPDRFNIYNDPSWKPLLDLAENHTDLIRMRSPVRTESHRAWGDQSDTKSVRDEFFEVENIEKNGCQITRITLTVGGRTMTTLTKREPDIDTVWTTEHLLESKEDVLAYMQLPDEVFTENIDVTSLLAEEEALGDRGIVMVDTEDPVCAAATMFSMEDFTILALTEQELFHQLLQKLSKQIWRRTEKVAAEFPGRLWRIYGPEFACEPYLPPKLFQEYVVRYTGPMVKMIKAHGGFARVHAHGKIKNVLDHIVSMGADAIDPVEPVPQGDVQLKDVREQYGDQLVFFGNIEVTDIENLPADKFSELIDRTLEEIASTSGRGCVVMPSASPFGRKVPAQTLRNYETLVQKTCDFDLA
ncbi:MAG: uroporphyrinogen decarboxylase family protein [Planctomycetota bacterium]|jgi:uroporphyrinogen-III decarboxylase